MSLSIYSNINNGQVDCCVLGLCGAGSRQYSPHSCRWDGTKEVYWMIHCHWKRKKRASVGSDNSNSSFLFQHSVAGLIQSVLKWQGWLKTNDWWETFSFNSFPHSADSSGLPVLLGALRVDQPDLEDPAEDQLDPPWPGHQETKFRNDQYDLQPGTRRPTPPNGFITTYLKAKLKSLLTRGVRFIDKPYW